MDKKNLIIKYGWPMLIIGSAAAAIVVYFLMQGLTSLLPFLTAGRDTVSVETGAFFGIIVFIFLSIWEICNS